MNKRVKKVLKKILRPTETQIQVDRLLEIVKEMVELLTSKIYPLCYTK